MITREELYELVWSKPMTNVAEQFKVSGSYMARVCTALRVPRPERGYWAKRAVGKRVVKQPLPEARPGEQTAWSKDSGLYILTIPQPIVPSKGRRTKITGMHGLIHDAKAHFEAGRPVEEGKHLKPYKKLLVDVTASKTCLDKALDFANSLFNRLESSGHRVVLATEGHSLQRDKINVNEDEKKRHHNYYPGNMWSPSRPTSVYIETVAIGLTIVEMTEDVLMRYINEKYIRESDYIPPKTRRYNNHTWTTTKEMATGRLRLIAYSPYWQAAWSMTWQETKRRPLTRDIPAIVKAIENGAKELVEKLKEAERKAEIERKQWLVEEERRGQEEDRRRVQQSIKDSQTQLSQIIQAWSDMMNVERFLQGVEDRAAHLSDDKRDQILDRLMLARKFVGTQDPLDFFLSWKTPTERYQPLSSTSSATAASSDDIASNENK